MYLAYPSNGMYMCNLYMYILRVSNNVVPWWLQYLYSRVSPIPVPLLPLQQGVSYTSTSSTFTLKCLQYLQLLCLYSRVSPISVPPLPLLQGVSNTCTSSAFTPGCLQYYAQGCDPGCLQYVFSFMPILRVSPILYSKDVLYSLAKSRMTREKLYTVSSLSHLFIEETKPG